MQPHPADWPRITSAAFYDDAAAAIDWLVTCFGFDVRLRIEGEGGRIEHSELEYGEGLIMVGQTGERPDRPDFAVCKSPRALDGANTQSLCVYVDDVDAHCEHARKHGAKIAMEPRTDDYGEEHGANRTYLAVDLEGHRWWFLHRVREPNPNAG
jgi:uncharacterized glyoxalase superfamily protein PhnB